MADIRQMFRVPPMQPGAELLLNGVYVFRCPVCRKEFRYDDPYGPMCTGASETRDEHAPVAMILLRKDPPRVMV